MKQKSTYPVQILSEKNAQSTTSGNNFDQQGISDNKYYQEPLTAMDENNKLVRRHSFDDNGWGYQGL
jgi:hypothetical protein